MGRVKIIIGRDDKSSDSEADLPTPGIPKVCHRVKPDDIYYNACQTIITVRQTTEGRAYYEKPKKKPVEVEESPEAKELRKSIESELLAKKSNIRRVLDEHLKKYYADDTTPDEKKELDSKIMQSIFEQDRIIEQLESLNKLGDEHLKKYYADDTTPDEKKEIDSKIMHSIFEQDRIIEQLESILIPAHPDSFDQCISNSSTDHSSI